MKKEKLFEFTMIPLRILDRIINWFELPTYNDGSVADPQDQKLYTGLSIATVAMMIPLALVAGWLIYVYITQYA